MLRSMASRVLVGSVIAALYLFLLAPILVTAIMSFSNDAVLSYPPSRWGGRWYLEVLGNSDFRKAFRVSIVIALAVMTLCLLAGLPAAYAIARYRFRGRNTLFALFTAPLLLPSIVLGVGILLVFVRMHLTGTYVGLILGHLVVAFPFVLRILTTSFAGLPPDLEDAASTLGAPPWKVVHRVTLPLMVPGLIASMALAFLVSFDEVVISLFLVGPTLRTLPVEVFSYVNYRVDPQIAALSVILIVVSVLIVIVIERCVGMLRALGRQ
jgi:putative spermidine/putrescine transport system permease protein